MENRTIRDCRFVLGSDLEPEIEVKPWPQLRGQLDEPVRQTSAIALSIYPDARTQIGTARPAAVGAIIGSIRCRGGDQPARFRI